MDASQKRKNVRPSERHIVLFYLHEVLEWISVMEKNQSSDCLVERCGGREVPQGGGRRGLAGTVKCSLDRSLTYEDAHIS